MYIFVFFVFFFKVYIFVEPRTFRIDDKLHALIVTWYSLELYENCYIWRVNIVPVKINLLNMIMIMKLKC